MGLLTRLIGRQRKRQIFRFFDGKRERGADPLAVIRALNSHPEFDPATTPTEATAPDLPGTTAEDRRRLDAAASAAAALTARATLEAFGVKPYDDDTGEGLTEGEALNLFSEFHDWLEAQKKNISRPAT